LLLGPGVLVDFAREILPGPLGLTGELLGMLDEALAPPRSGCLQEVGPANLQDIIDEASELVEATDREVPFEKDSSGSKFADVYLVVIY
jgi:hypothetical protein